MPKAGYFVLINIVFSSSISLPPAQQVVLFVAVTRSLSSRPVPFPGTKDSQEPKLNFFENGKFRSNRNFSLRGGEKTSSKICHKISLWSFLTTVCRMIFSRMTFCHVAIGQMTIS